MFVSDWMTTKVFTLASDDNIMSAIKLLKEKKIKHIPVVKNDSTIVGILSDRDIKDYTPSKVTTFELKELNYILFTAKVKEIMKKKVISATPNMAIEEAAMIMFDNNIGCLPVVEKGKLAGIISDKDLFRVLVDITGVRHGGNRFYVVMKDKPGVTGEVLDIVKKNGFTLDSVLTTYEGVQKGYKRVVVRTIGKGGDLKKAQVELKTQFGGPFI
jgi:acetoin utilization protein AcuB